MLSLPTALKALIGKMFIGKATVSMKGEGKADKGEGPPGKGAPLGDEGGHLLHGVGYGVRDKHTQKKNLAEKTNMKTFLEAKQGKDGDAVKTEMPVENPAGDKGEAPEATERQAEPREARDAKDQEVRREEVREEARVVGQQEAKETEAKEQVKEAEPEQKQGQDEQDEEDKPGAGWVAEEGEADEEDARQGLRQRDQLTEQTRCKGSLEDGTRCLRKPVKGLGYCREHSVNWRPDVSAKA